MKETRNVFFYLEKLKGRDYFGDQGVDGRVR
jgi:hypothetical protein